MDKLLSIQAIVPFLTLFALELVLGIDNIIFISILSGKLPASQQDKARTIDQHFSKAYIYFAMGFSLFVETLNTRLRKKSAPVHLKQTW